jgi:hypothetical protein
VEGLARSVQEATGESVELAYVDRGYTGEAASVDAGAHGIRLELVKHPGAKKGFVLLPRRWDRGALLRVGDPFQEVGEGLRAVARDGGGAALRRLRLPLPAPSGHRARPESITASSAHRSCKVYKSVEK